jgi:hypothetical protein
MWFRWQWLAARALVVAGLALSGASCSKEGTANPETPSGSATGETSKAVVFDDPFEWHRFEAEEAETIEGSILRIVEDEEASGGKCLEIPDKAGTPKEGKYARAVYRFTIEKAGDYVFWARRKWLNQCGDSFVVRFDQEGQPRDLDTETVFGNDDMSPAHWAWSPVYVEGNPRQFYFTAGEHVMEILNREDGPRVDVFLLTDEVDYVPMGLEE